MKQLFLVITIAMCLSSALQAQKVLNPIITLQLPEGDGSNAAAVVWNPNTKFYYTTMVGNAIYAMAIFDAKGKTIENNIDADFDYRGMWYNTKTKRIEFNCYDSAGIGHLVLDKKGKISEKVIDFEGMRQPQDQNVGVYCPVDNSILYLNTSTHLVSKYSAETGELTDVLTTAIHVGCKTQKEADDLTANEDEEYNRWEERNMSSVQYTGISKAELALLNTQNNTIELYDIKTGLLSKTFYKIPKSITLNSSFNFSYCNGIWWFFNKDKRKWVGCK